MDKERVQKLIEEAVLANESLFLVDWSIGVGNKILVCVDGDNGLPLKECVRISRHIEHNLLEDEVERDFSLEVTSPGIGNPLKWPRQFKKNIGRQLIVILNNDEKYKGELKNANEQKIFLEWQEKEKKLNGKGNQKVTKNKEIFYTDIKTATIEIKI
jgi:ribosome maturation factor RimP